MPLYRRASAERNVAQHHTESLDYHLINNKALQWHHHSSRHVQRRVLGYVSPLIACAVRVMTRGMWQRCRHVLASTSIARECVAVAASSSNCCR